MKKTMKIITILTTMILIAAIATACMFSFTSQTIVTAKQSVVIDNKNWDEKINQKITAYGGNTYCFKHTITNRGNKDIKLKWITTGKPDLTGITITIGSYKKGHSPLYPPIGCTTCGTNGYLIPMKTSFTLKAGQTINLCFCYTLDMLIKPGKYTITTILLPN